MCPEIFLGSIGDETNQIPNNPQNRVGEFPDKSGFYTSERYGDVFINMEEENVAKVRIPSVSAVNYSVSVDPATKIGEHEIPELSKKIVVRLATQT